MGKFFGRLEVEWRKVVCWSTKVAISQKRLKIDKKLLWGAHRNSFVLPNGTILDPLRPPLPQDWGFAPHPNLQSLLSHERVKLRLSNLASTVRGSIRTKAHEKFWRKGSVGVSRYCPNFLPVPPIISGTGRATAFKFGQYIQRVHPNKSPWKIMEKRKCGVSRDWYPLLSQEQVKLWTSHL